MPADGPSKPAETNAPQDARTYVRAEHAAIQEQALLEDWHELTRRRVETEAALKVALGKVGSEHEQTERMAAALRSSLQTLRDCEDGATPDAATVRQTRQKLHDAAIQLAMFERRDEEHGNAMGSLATMTFAELSRLGLAISLPLIVALLMAALIVAVGMRLALGMP
jgi:hypothetical protein